MAIPLTVATAYAAGTLGFAVVAVHGTNVRYTLSLPTAALSATRPGEQPASADDEPPPERLRSLVAREIWIAADGHACSPGIGRAVAAPQAPGTLVITAQFQCPAPPRILSIRDDLADALGADHRTLAQIEVAGGARSFTFTTLQREARVDLVSGVLAARPPSYLQLGLERMLTGLAQLLVIVAVIAGAGNLRTAIAAVSSFAAGCIATAALSVAGALPLASPAAGALAGAAVVAAAALNLFPIVAIGPGAVASGALGAMQGFDLGQALGAVPMLPGERAAALAQFALGLLLGSAVIALVTLPLWLWLWRRWAQRARAAVSWPVLLAGLALGFGAL
jgi:hypothetical protein